LSSIKPFLRFDGVVDFGEDCAVTPALPKLLQRRQVLEDAKQVLGVSHGEFDGDHLLYRGHFDGGDDFGKNCTVTPAFDTTIVSKNVEQVLGFRHGEFDDDHYFILKTVTGAMVK